MIRLDATRLLAFALTGMVFVAAPGCGGDGDASDSETENAQPANEVVRARIASRAPAANLGHRGTGVNRPGHALPENSIPSYLAAMQQGADGIELDVELTADGKLVIMHDDTLDRTTTCVGCVSAQTLAAARACVLRDGNGRQTSEHPPTLEEVYRALPGEALVNVELKVYGSRCLTAASGPRVLAQAAVAEVKRLGAASRTLFSSFDEEAVAEVKALDPHLYVALLFSEFTPEVVHRAVELHLDAIHPFFMRMPADISGALDAGLQVNTWTVNSRSRMEQSLDKRVSAIITDEPALLNEVLVARR